MTTRRQTARRAPVVAVVAVGLVVVSLYGLSSEGEADVVATRSDASDSVDAPATDEGPGPSGDGASGAGDASGAGEGEGERVDGGEPGAPLEPGPFTSAVPTTTSPVEPDPEPGPRDPWIRPFSSTSIWNVPIGSEAQFVPANLPATNRHLLEEVTLMRTDTSDPLREIVRLGSWTDRCSGTERSGRSLHLPDGWQPPDVTATATPNNPGVFLMPDGRTLTNLNAMGRCAPDGPLFAQWPDDPEKQTSDLYGDGQLGAHGASNLSQIGGAIRPGELSGERPIDHALDLLIWAEHLWWGGDKPSSYRWPATNSDAYAGPARYRGTNPELRMGSLLALPPDLTPDDVGVTTPVGQRLFAALQDHGAYVTDDSAWDATYLGVDAAALGTFDWGRDERADMSRLVQNLHVVANNGPERVGGGGEPRKPLLPELVPPDE